MKDRHWTFHSAEDRKMEDRLFANCSPVVRQLEKQSRREKRLAKRKEWKAGSLMEETSNAGSPVRRKKDV